MSSRFSSEFIQVKTTKKKTDALLEWGTEQGKKKERGREEITIGGER